MYITLKEKYIYNNIIRAQRGNGPSTDKRAIEGDGH